MAVVNQSAKTQLNTWIEQTFGIKNLGDWAWKTYTESGGGTLGTTAVSQGIYETPEFNARYPAYKELAKSGQAMSVAAMQQYEEQARQLMHNAGLPPGFYDQPDDFAKLMVNNVGFNELEQRVANAQQAVAGATPEFLAQMKRLYGVDQGHLTAYALDATKAEPLIMRTFQAAQAAAESQITGYGELSQGQAERLADLGVNQQTAREGFSTLAAEKGLFQAQRTGEDTIDSGTVLEAQFGGNANAARRIQQRKQARQAAFAGGSGFGAGQQGVQGLGSTT